MVGLPDDWKNFEDMYNRLHRIPACDGQTYRRTDGQGDRQTSCHGIVRAMHTRRAVKMQAPASRILKFLFSFGGFTPQTLSEICPWTDPAGELPFCNSGYGPYSSSTTYSLEIQYNDDDNNKSVCTSCICLMLYAEVQTRLLCHVAEL